jgi:hypothetical protein
MMPERRPSKHVLLAVFLLIASSTAFFVSCGLMNLYPYDVHSIIVYDGFHETEINKATFRHTINTDVQTVGYNVYYVYSDDENVDPDDFLDTDIQTAEVDGRENKTPKIEIVEKDAPSVIHQEIYGLVEFDTIDNTFGISLYNSISDLNNKTNPLQLHDGKLNETISNKDGDAFTDEKRYLYLFIEYKLIDPYDFQPQDLAYLGYVDMVDMDVSVK